MVGHSTEGTNTRFPGTSVPRNSGFCAGSSACAECPHRPRYPARAAVSVIFFRFIMRFLRTPGSGSSRVIEDGLNDPGAYARGARRAGHDHVVARAGAESRFVHRSARRAEDQSADVDGVGELDHVVLVA